jgi:hypothetical protein
MNLRDGVAIDAHVMKRFHGDMLAQEQSLSALLVEQVIEKIGLAIDYGGKIQHEWFTQCPTLLFREWFIQNIKLGRIRTFKAAIDDKHKRALFIDLGFPRRGYDIVYVGVANVTEKRYIVTDDIDFFDPKHKKSGHEKKEKIKKERNCAVCAYLRKHLNIVVGTPLHAQTELLPPES